MKCPFCETELIEGKKEKFETLFEHCLDPNKEKYPLRITFKCPNKKCVVNKKSFWDEDGGFYTKLLRSDYINQLPDNFTSALDSLERDIDMKIKDTK